MIWGTWAEAWNGLVTTARRRGTRRISFIRRARLISCGKIAAWDGARDGVFTGTARRTREWRMEDGRWRRKTEYRNSQGSAPEKRGNIRAHNHESFRDREIPKSKTRWTDSGKDFALTIGMRGFGGTKRPGPRFRRKRNAYENKIHLPCFRPKVGINGRRRRSAAGFRGNAGRHHVCFDVGRRRQDLSEQPGRNPNDRRLRFVHTHGHGLGCGREPVRGESRLGRDHAVCARREHEPVRCQSERLWPGLRYVGQSVRGGLFRRQYLQVFAERNLQGFLHRVVRPLRPRIQPRRRSLRIGYPQRQDL